MNQAVKQLFRALTFRTTAEDIQRWGYWELAVGILCTWMVGIGRWWDDPRDLPPLVRFGLGSVAYVLIFTAVMWAVIRPIADNAPSVRQVLTFVCFVSPPAALYAIPVERWTGMEVARELNLIFLLVVAVYRVVLLYRFCQKSVQMGWFRAILATFLPISIAVFTMSVMNLLSRIVEFMGGIREEETRRKSMEEFVMTITVVSVVVAPILIICYLYTTYKVNTAKDD